jgi:DNA-binding transcriptional MerR regulator
MQENPAPEAEQPQDDRQPDTGATQASPSPPKTDESWKGFYDRGALEQIERLRQAEIALREVKKSIRETEEAKREAEKATREAEEATRKIREEILRMKESIQESEEATRKIEAKTLRMKKSIQETEEATRESEESLRMMVVRRRQKGHSDAVIADDLDWTVAELVARYPAPT